MGSTTGRPEDRAETERWESEKRHRYEVKVLVNVDDDNFFGYKPEHPLALVTDRDGQPITFIVETANAQMAANRMWSVGNKMNPDDAGTDWPRDIRSLSVGDVVTVRKAGNTIQHTFAVASVGWEYMPPELSNPIVPIEGTRHTSRER